MSKKSWGEVQGGLEWEILNYWIHAGVFDADKIITGTKKIVNLISTKQLSLEQFEIRLSEEPQHIQQQIKEQITENNTLQDMLDWKNSNTKKQMTLLVKQLICSRGVKNPDVIIFVVDQIHNSICRPSHYIIDITNEEREKYNFKQFLLMRIAESNHFELPDINIFPTISKLEDFLFHNDDGLENNEFSDFQIFIEECEKQIQERSKVFTLPKGAIIKLCSATLVLQDSVEALGDPVGIKYVMDRYEQLDAQDLLCEYVGEGISFNDFRELNPCLREVI